MKDLGRFKTWEIRNLLNCLDPNTEIDVELDFDSHGETYFYVLKLHIITDDIERRIRDLDSGREQIVKIKQFLNLDLLYDEPKDVPYEELPF